jgi:hypothetical protein
MKLREWKQSKDKNTTKLSDINRNLAFVGLGLIWIFKTETSGHYAIPPELIGPSFLLVLALFLDFLQYLYLSFIWTIFFKYHEWNRKKKPTRTDYVTDDIKANQILPNISYVFFVSKILANGLAYLQLLKYLLHLLTR